MQMQQLTSVESQISSKPRLQADKFKIQTIMSIVFHLSRRKDSKACPVASGVLYIFVLLNSLNSIFIVLLAVFEQTATSLFFNQTSTQQISAIKEQLAFL